MTVTNRPRRANGEGSVYWIEARQRWAYTISLPNGPRKTRTFKTRAEASRGLKSILKQQADGELGIARADLTMAKFLRGWIDNVVLTTMKPLTHQTYDYIVKGRLIPAIGTVSLAKLGPEHIERLQADMVKHNFSLNTIKLMRTTLSAALSYAVERRLIGQNPLKTVKLPRSHNLEDEDDEPRVFTVDELLLLQEAMVGDEYEPYFHFMIMTAIRPGEARGVRWQDIDFERRIFRLRRQTIELKGGRREFGTPKSRQGKREIPLLAPAMAVFEAQRQRVQFMRQTPGWQENDLVFPSANGRPIVARTVNMHLTALCKKAGIEHATPHTLRHATSTYLLIAGASEREAQDLLGHASNATTRRYQHVLPEMRVRAMERLDTFFKANGILYRADEIVS